MSDIATVIGYIVIVLIIIAVFVGTVIAYLTDDAFAKFASKIDLEVAQLKMKLNKIK